MRSPNKSRSRNKNRRNNNSNNIGNVVNRVFDSSGPEGRVRGTPNQLVEKYEALARDAVLAGDRVTAENFSQHAEHYIRLLGEAKAALALEQASRQAEEDAKRKEREEQDAKRVEDDAQDIENAEEIALPNGADHDQADAAEKPKKKAVRKSKDARVAKPSQEPKGFESADELPVFLQSGIGDE